MRPLVTYLPPPSGKVQLPRTLRSAFLLPADTFDLIYGDEAAARLAEISALQPGPVSVDWAAGPDLPEWLEEIDVAFTGWHTPRFDARLLRRMPRLRAVFHGGGTIRPHVSDEFWKRGITITTAARANSVPVAEFTHGLIILSLKRAWSLNRDFLARRAFSVAHPRVPGALGSTVGIVSMGLIGRLVRERLRDLQVRVVAHDPYLPDKVFRELDVEPVSLPELMRRSDVVSLHSPLNAETRGLIGRELLDLMKPGATLVNTARGGLLREDELVAFLRRREDVQAVLDVTEPMPPNPVSPLFDLPNVFLTPHIAGSLGPECRRMGRTMLAEFERYLVGQPLLYSVSREDAVLRA